VKGIHPRRFLKLITVVKARRMRRSTALTTAPLQSTYCWAAGAMPSAVRATMQMLTERLIAALAALGAA
jgi:hypothetical protein